MIAIGNKIIVKPFPAKEVSKGGIFLPETARERMNKATVVSVGRGTKDQPMKLRVGMTVFNLKDTGTEIRNNGEVFYIMPQQDVLAYIEN